MKMYLTAELFRTGADKEDVVIIGFMAHENRESTGIVMSNDGWLKDEPVTRLRVLLPDEKTREECMDVK